MPSYCLLISNRDDDSEVAQRISKENGLELIQMTAPDKIHDFLMNNKPALVFWNVDMQNPNDPSEKVIINTIGQSLVDNKVAGERVFGIRKKEEDQTSFVFSNPAYATLLLRQFNDLAYHVIGYLSKNSILDDPFGIEKYLPKDAQIQKIVLKNSQHRAAATDAVNNVLVKRGYNSRLASSIAKAVDEMLMNAIFDAPMDNKKNYYRNGLLRTTVFDLKDKEEVTLQVGTCGHYGVVSVVDQFGSLQKNVALKRLQKDYTSIAYEVSDKTVGAGVGIYGIIHSGLSMHFICRPGVKTEVLLFFPIVKSIKELRSSFRFVGFFNVK